MVFPIAGGNQSSGDFITNSLRFNDGDSPSLSLDLSSPNTDKFTISFWVKLTGARTQLAALGKRLTGEAGDDYSINIEQGSTGRMGINAYNGIADSNIAAYNSNTNAGSLLRDVSAWYHIVYAFDTGQGTAANRFKWYINGVLQSGYNTTTTPSQNADLFPSSGSMIRIGKALNTETRFADCYIAQYYYVDGQQYDHTYFGETNDNGVWVPVENGKGAGGAITFGTNGFYLEFKETGTSANASGIGADTSGNNKHLTPANLAAVDITTDTPQNNFCTFNPIFTGQRGTFSEGNTQLVTDVQGSANYGQSVLGTFLLSSGKWYWEIECEAIGSGGNTGIGANERVDGGAYSNGSNSLGSTGNSHYNSSGFLKISAESNVTSSVDSYTSGDIIGVALDLDNSKIYWSKNGSFQASGNPSSNSNGISLTSSYNDNWVPFCSKDDTNHNATFIANFGNPPTTISSGNSDANGHGNFEYAVPTGFFAINTKNLAEHG